MKRLSVSTLLPACAAVVLILSGCSKSILDYRNVEIDNGKIYRGDAYSSEGDSDKPFSGTVTNYPIDEVVSANSKGMVKFLSLVALGSTIDDPKNAAAVNNFGTGNGAISILATTRAICDVSVRGGYLDGHADCKVPNSDVESTQMDFDEGTLDGDITYFDSQGKKWAEGAFKDGLPDGREKVYSRKNGNLVLQAQWENGGLNGEESAYDPNTGEVIYDVNYENGNRQGVATHYSSDGEKTETETFVDNAQNGAIDTYDAKTGAHTFHGIKVNGLLNGEAYEWDSQGRLLGTYAFKDGFDMTPLPQVAPVDCTPEHESKRILAESLICSSKELLADDSLVMKAYRTALASIAGNNSLEDEQREWIKSSRNKCLTVTCLEQAYKAQIAMLAKEGQPSLRAIDCAPTRDPVVSLICSSQGLLEDDKQMIASYRAAYLAVAAARKDAIDIGVMGWETSLQNHCKDAPCIDSAYKDFTIKLNAIARDPATPFTADSLSRIAAPTPLPASSAVPPPQISARTSHAPSPFGPKPASVDCANASTFAERMICSKQSLADQDQEMMDAYKAALASGSNESALERAQNAWITQRDSCTSWDCLDRAYQKRIAELRAVRSE